MNRTLIVSHRLNKSLCPRTVWNVCMRRFGVALLLTLIGFVAGTASATTVPGAIPGSFGVSETGAATYSIPIAIPPGTAGMEPKLSLNYSSQGGNGIAGVGWSLGGLSAITRCPQTIAQDGQTRGVQLDANDRFCLDGQRLVIVNGGTYGAVGAEYRTEIESFSKVVSYGGTVGDPQYFKVWTKAGQIVEYGNTADSRVEAQGKTIAAAWAADRISDTVSNYITFTYFEDTANGEHRIQRIDYTGNATTGVAPYNAVEFEYETRPDIETIYIKGSKSQTSQRLLKMLTRQSGNVVKDYSLIYEVGSTTGRSRLVSLTQCAANGDCLAPTTFAWQEGEAGLNATAQNTGISGSNALYARAIDVNGDGKTDIVYPTGTTWKVRLSQGDSFSSEIDTGILNTGYQYARPLDFNSDGRIDMLVPYANGHWYLMRATGDPASPFAAPVDTGLTDGGKAANPQIADINGDGLPDIVHAHDSYWYSALGTGAGFAADVQSNMPYVQNGYGYYAFDWGRPADFQGDGLADVLIPRLYQRYLCGGFAICEDIRWDVLSRPGTGPLTNLPTNITANLYSGIAGTGVVYVQKSQQAIDINRDGNTDLLSMGPNGAGGASWWLCQNWGGDLVHCANTGFSAPQSGQTMIQSDWNGDGKPDMLVATNGGLGNWAVYQTNVSGMGMTSFDSGIAQQGYDANPLIGDFNGDGLLDLMLAYNGVWNLRLHNGPQPDLLLSITDGLGAARVITYKALADNSVYTKGLGATFPQIDVQDATYVVSETAADDGIGGQFHMAYHYAGARTHMQGRGFLGFAVLEQTDSQTGIVTRTNYRQDFPYIDQPTLVTKSSSGGVELNRIETTHAVKAIPGGGQFPYLAYSKEQSRDLNGAILPLSETWNTYGDDWGNLTKTIIQTSDGFKKQTDSVYTNDGTKWLLGRLARATVTSSVDNGSWTLSRVSAFEYDPSSGLLKKEIVEPDQPQFRLDTAYAYDAFGNRSGVTISSPATGTAAIVSRTTTTGYDTKGQFPATVSNALGHTETKVFDARFGTVTSLTGPNNLTTTWQYDGFGRKTRETRIDGTYIVWTYAACDAACPGWGVYRVVTQVYASDGTQAAPANVAYFDKLNREVRTAVQGLDGRWIYKDTVYDNRGNADKISRPYYVGDTVYWIDQGYDDLNRLIQVIEPDNVAKPALVVDYNGLTVTRTNRKDQVTLETRDSQGQKVTVTDALAQTTLYHYDPFGNLQYVLNPGGSLESLSVYDTRGRKTWSYTPDMGGWTYEYNALGELVKQTDAKSQITSFVYDVLGRMTQRVEPGLTSTWTWDSAAYGKGKLQSAQTSAGYFRSHWYDDKGRSQLALSNLGAGNPLFFTSVAYDAAGRISQQYLPGGVATKRVYNSLGYETELRNVSGNTLYWQLNTMDAEGHATQETLGNGTGSYTTYNPQNGRFNYRIDNRNGVWIDYYYQGYDDLGNINSRYHLGGGGGDNLIYDALNRLTQVQHYGNASAIDTIVYGPGGNIRNRTSVGDYYYGGSPNCVNNNVGPHAVCRAGTNAYSYDANGNLTGGGGRSLTWTAWNMPASTTQGGQTTTWLYGPEHDRYKMIAPGRTTWYLNPGIQQGGHYEQTLYANGTTEFRSTLYGGGRPMGEIVSFDDGSPNQVRYFHSDAQGSITAVTDSAGTVLTRFRYDPWGKQTLVSGSNTGVSQTRQGHTGHEMLDGGLTHMNGRLYDPVLARFVSADPIVQDPYNLQSLNRYSYVLNNPLYYTDPTGFSAWTDFRDGFLKPVLSIAAAAYLPGSSFFNSMGITGLSGQIAAGAIAGGISGGGRGALAGAVSAGMFSQLHGMSPGLGKVVAHGVAGGMMSEMQGGSFKSGFLAAGFTQGASQLGVFNNLGDPNTWGGRTANAIGAAIVGGTASVIGGGKFSNGAMTGAFSRLFNDLYLKGVPKKDWKGRTYVEGMATLTDSGTGEVLISTPAISGPYGKGPLPEGDYDGKNFRPRTTAAMTVTDSQGKTGWSLDLNPQFDTNREFLRMHPDGNVRGTKGCISPETQAREWGRLLQDQVKQHGSIPVHVSY